MNRRLARKKALLKSGRFPRVAMARGLFEQTGSVAMATGVWKPLVLIDPRAYGEDQTLRTFWLYHEAAHVILSHTRILFVLRWLGILFAADLGVIFGVLVCSVLQLSAPWPVVFAAIYGLPAAWLEARFGFFTLWFRARAETEADSLALSVMLPHAFASAVKTMFAIQTPQKGLDGWVDEKVYGKDWRERCARQGLAYDGPD